MKKEMKYIITKSIHVFNYESCDFIPAGIILYTNGDSVIVMNPDGEISYTDIKTLTRFISLGFIRLENSSADKVKEAYCLFYDLIENNGI